MFGATPAWFTVGAAGFLAAAVSLLFQFVKPLLEAIPLLKPGSAAHDTTLRAVVYLLNLAGIVALAATANAFDVRQWLQYAVLAGAQALGGHLLYTTTISGKVDAVDVPGGAVLPPLAPAAATPAAPDASVVASGVDPSGVDPSAPLAPTSA